MIDNFLPIIEEWKDINGWDGYYMISNWGRVMSLARTVEQGNRMMKVPSKVLKPVLNKKTENYTELVVYFTAKNKMKKKYRISRLVAEHFVKNKDDKKHINHIDSNPMNNFYLNLEWCTQLENMQHASKKGRMVGRPR